jgi:hypothetical protein
MDDARLANDDGIFAFANDDFLFYRAGITPVIAVSAGKLRVAARRERSKTESG